MRKYRLSLTDGKTDPSGPFAAIDNVTISFVPEPGPAGLLALSCAGYLILCRRRKQRGGRA